MFEFTPEARSFLLERMLDSPNYTGELREDVEEVIPDGEPQDYYRGLVTGIALIGEHYARLKDRRETLEIFEKIFTLMLVRACVLWKPIE